MRPTPVLALLAFLIVSPVHAVFQSYKDGPTTAFMQGNSSNPVGEIVVITSSGGLLVHNRATDPGFNSAFDFDSMVPGDQTLAAAPTSFLYVGSGAGPDVIRIGGSFGSFSAPADQTFAEIVISNVTTPGKQVVVDNTLSSQNQTFLITSTLITAAGINVFRGPLGPPYDVRVVGGSGNDTFNVESLAPNAINEPLSLFPNGGTNSVNIGTLGNLDAVDQNIHITGFTNNTALTINDSANAFGRIATIMPTTFFSPTLTHSFSWDANALSSLTANFGPAADTVNINGVPANAATTVNGGDGNDIFNVSPGAPNGAQITINGDAPTTPPGDTLNYTGGGGVVVGNQILKTGATPVTFNSIETLNGAGPFIAFGTINPTYAENGGPQTVTLTLSGPLATPVTVNVVVAGGTATPGADFNTPSFDFGSGFPATVTFPAGATTASLIFNVVNDGANEPPETAVLALASPSANATIGSPSTTTITITSDDFAPSDVPTLSEIALVLFGLLLVIVAMRRL